jgi:hypothetical protein
MIRRLGSAADEAGQPDRQGTTEAKQAGTLEQRQQVRNSLSTICRSQCRNLAGLKQGCVLSLGISPAA